MFKKLWDLLCRLFHVTPTAAVTSVGITVLKAATIAAVTAIAAHVIKRTFKFAFYWISALMLLLFAGAIALGIILGLPLPAIIIAALLAPVASAIGVALGYGRVLSRGNAESRLERIKKMAFDFTSAQLLRTTGKLLLGTLPLIVLGFSSGFLFFDPIPLPLMAELLGIGLLALFLGVSVGFVAAHYRQWRDRNLSLNPQFVDRQEEATLAELEAEVFDQLRLSHSANEYSAVVIPSNTIEALPLEALKQSLRISISPLPAEGLSNARLSLLPALKVRQQQWRLCHIQYSPYHTYQQIIQLHRLIQSGLNHPEPLQQFFTLEHKILSALIATQCEQLVQHFSSLSLVQEQLHLNGLPIDWQADKAAMIVMLRQHTTDNDLITQLSTLHDRFTHQRSVHVLLQSEQALTRQLERMAAIVHEMDETDERYCIPARLSSHYQNLDEAMLIRMSHDYLPFLHNFHQAQMDFIDSQTPGAKKKILAIFVMVITFPWNIMMNRITHGQWFNGLLAYIMDWLYHDQLQTGRAIRSLMQCGHRERIVEANIAAINREKAQHFHTKVLTNPQAMATHDLACDPINRAITLSQQALMNDTNDSPVYWILTRYHSDLIAHLCQEIACHPHDVAYQDTLRSLQCFINGQHSAVWMLVKKANNHGSSELTLLHQGFGNGN